jgi:hypothetical protein
MQFGRRSAVAMAREYALEGLPARGVSRRPQRVPGQEQLSAVNAISAIRVLVNPIRYGEYHDNDEGNEQNRER